MADHGPTTLAVRSEGRGDGVIISPQGDVDMTGSPVLRQELKRVQGNRPARIVVDLGGVPYMDSSGVATLVEALQAAKRSQTKLLLCGMQDKVRSIFEIARLDAVFTIVATADAAMKA
ncbi:MAG: STAS domain-containing protein [Phycisphaerae bacterium]|nr:STAS domain-containing protein [Phycisphaerae bacterium]